jgi:hypothetical protein
LIRTIVNKGIVLGALVVVALAVITVLLVIITSTTAETSDWPPFTMIYEIEGAKVMVGSELIQLRPEIR